MSINKSIEEAFVLEKLLIKFWNFVINENVITWCALSSACYVNTSSNYIRVFTSVSQMPAESHLIEIARHIDTVLVQSMIVI